MTLILSLFSTGLMKCAYDQNAKRASISVQMAYVYRRQSCVMERRIVQTEMMKSLNAVGHLRTNNIVQQIQHDINFFLKFSKTSKSSSIYNHGIIMALCVALSANQQSLACTFEEAYMCGYREVSTTSAEWNRMSGSGSNKGSPTEDSKGSSIGE